ncbi:MAG: DUF58 domain-containing protein [Bacteroidota bacterium]|nr:DUF58 domain-containing protein [Bacteroidota bacterium]MDX5427285.1 DUF58 domain-containing protein [Bacteroidota bacterium]MDX5449257.1 DUF58 domain-containing protein [Bacteroidota bacterium]MDX5505237.1 DUF58 domain-containing protein [Bacteroidota bacterium]
MNTQELLKKVRLIEIKSRRLSENIFSGEYHSSFKGRGMAFSEVRGYQSGDDIRSIDWNVSARKGEPFIKVFEEERELTLMLLIDVSGSGRFGSRQQEKRELITEMSATLAFSAIKNNDKVGVIFFSDRVEKFIPPKKGRTHILRIIREMIEFKPTGRGTRLDSALEYLAGVMKKRAIVFVMSDFDSSTYSKPLKVASRRHDLTGVFIYDAFEEHLPNLGLVPVVDAESGKTGYLNTSSRTLRRRSDELFWKRLQTFKQEHLKSGAGSLIIRTDESYPKKLHAYFQKRSAR